MQESASKILWQPTPEFIRASNLKQYTDWLEREKRLKFRDYEALWRWSIDYVEDFWESIWQYFQIKSYTPYRQVCLGMKMPGARWFEGATLNYAEHIFRNKTDEFPAIIFKSEQHEIIEFSWAEMEGQVASMANYLKEIGVQTGDRVVAYLPNIPEATIAFLACASIGAVWSSCSPDFGANSVIERFNQIEPKVLFAVDGYSYNGKEFDKTLIVKELCEKFSTLKKVVWVSYLNVNSTGQEIPNSVRWVDTFRPQKSGNIEFTPVPFEHPIWVLYSSGTTGIPKAITHSHGGVLLEHLKYLHFHNDIKKGERFFWFSTTGWMMWNFVQASFLAGATVVLYDGSPGYPNLETLWKLAADAQIHHFGTSAPFLVACMKENLKPGRTFDLKMLRSIGSTGSPLPPEAFDWVYKNIKKDIWLCSMAGGTDVCTAWVGGNPFLPVRSGEIQSRCLGASLFAFDEHGQGVEEEVGEMVITKPMPSMPIYFWNDPDGKKYMSSYFENFEGIWRHGDWVKITKEGAVVISGRSDATLNRGGVRIGTAEIYRAVEKVDEIQDSLIVNLELPEGKDYMPLFVVVKAGFVLNQGLKSKINRLLRTEYSPRHVPDDIIEIPEVPYTISGKKMESPAKKLLMGVPIEKAVAKGSMKNPDSLAFFQNFQLRRTH